MQIHLENSSGGPAKFLFCLTGFYGFLALAICLALCPAPAHAQQQTPPQIGFPASPGASPEVPKDPALRHMMHKMEKERNVNRQKKIEADTARLLDLAKELHAAVVKSNKNTLSIDVVKDADEIEKLAKSIKEKMRDGNY
jgi:hypothetical protein